VKRFLLSFICLNLANFAFADPNRDAAALTSSLSSLNFDLNSPRHTGNLRGWDYLAGLLVKEGVPPRQVVEVLSDSRMPERELLHFSLDPKESHHSYRKHNTKANRANALKFYLEHEQAFKEAKKRFGVPESVILSIVQVETFCGKNTGRSSIFPSLARLANARDPENLSANRARFDKSKEKKVEARAKYLEDTFLSHAAKTFKVAEIYGVSVHDLRGSFAGAMGIPQFLPGSFIDYGVDGSGDGKVDLFHPKDAILSTANYLKQKGWSEPVLPVKKQRAVVWEYNRSTPYIDTVLAMSKELSGVIQRGVREDDLKVSNDKRKTKRAAKAVYKRASRTS